MSDIGGHISQNPARRPAGKAPTRQIAAIQVLRAIAALMIVLSHAQNDALNEALKAGIAFTRTTIIAWDAGVDLFFVISGFIMVHASARLFGTAGGPRNFIARRMTRIVPLYWAITGLFLLVLVFADWKGKHAFASPAEIGASFGFIPFARPQDGLPRPIAAHGWTLNYEMFFYVVFALFVGFRRTVAVAGVALLLAVAVALGAILRPHVTAIAFWCDPIVLEFVLGALLALIWTQGFRWRRGWGLPLLGAGLLLLYLDPIGMGQTGPTAADPNGFGRFFACGVPMALIFAAVVLREPASATGDRLTSFLVALGDASYALYLFHPLVIILARKAYLNMGLAAKLGYWPLVAAEIPLAIGLAFAVHGMFEMPATAALNRWIFGERRLVNPSKKEFAEIRSFETPPSAAPQGEGRSG